MSKCEAESTESQCQILLGLLQSGKRITAMDGVRLFRSTRTGARVYDLRRKGYDVQSRLIKTRSGKRVSEYWLPVTEAKA